MNVKTLINIKIMSLPEASICPNTDIIKLKHYFEVESSTARSVMKFDAVKTIKLLEAQYVL